MRPRPLFVVASIVAILFVMAFAFWVTSTWFLRPLHWKYSSLPLNGTRFVAGVGPYSFGDDADAKWEYYAVDIEVPYGDGSHVVFSKDISLESVSPALIEAPASAIVRFDASTRLVTFDLGRTTIEYRLPK